MIGIIIGLWYEILFLTIWIIYSVTYPIVLLSIILPLLFYPQATIYKYYFIYTSLKYILFCQDKKKKKKDKKKKTKGTEITISSNGVSDDTSTENHMDDPSMYFPGYGTSTTSTTTGSSTTDDTTTSSTHSSTSSIINKKTILFIRHGESTWNYTFNKGNERSTLTFVLYFIPNLIRTIFMEYYYYMTGQCMESLLYDSPLSHNGIHQARTIQQFIQSSNLQFVTPKEEKFITLLKGHIATGTTTSSNDTSTTTTSTSTTTTMTTAENDNPDIVYMVSNLRRAITTAGIAFYTQLTTPTSSSSPPKLMIVSALQEISTNPDALCISPSSSSSTSSKSSMVGSNSDPIHIRRYIYGTSNSTSGSGVLDTTYHTGNKSISSTGRQRIQEFCHLLFHDTTSNTNTNISTANNYIVTGHSLWFLTFFQLLLPTSCNHIAKKKKLQNGSIIGFTLLHTTTTTTTTTATDGGTNDTTVMDHYMIDPISLVVVHGGF